MEYYVISQRLHSSKESEEERKRTLKSRDQKISGEDTETKCTHQPAAPETNLARFGHCKIGCPPFLDHDISLKHYLLSARGYILEKCVLTAEAEEKSRIKLVSVAFQAD
ncbi:hypothetical protein NDU88_006539 [Pleurodeles waltl]|uniref:Uncharacterized protein n=1 Tax=Pleurodeles waltl TaxID=8319 RepID=A0AAV7N8X5_PLEWA|nr:hypothetical protein NDU88_006539 [Pleurodeles waltl]